MKKKILQFFKKENKKKIIGSAFVIAIVVIVGIVAVCLHHEGDKEENVVYVNKVSDIVDPSASIGRLNKFSGVIETQKELKIQPDLDREIERINVKAGDEVEIGTVLFTYANQDTQEKLDRSNLDLERISNTIETKKKEIGAITDNLEKLEAQGELKRSELELKAKNIEIEKLKAALENVEFKSEMAGVIKEINPEGGYDNFSGKEKPFMTIITLGNYRVKGKINEQNIYDILAGQEVIIRSRIDDDVTWTGTITEVNTEQPEESGNDFMGGDGYNISSFYPFYVELNSSEGLMLGQHVYIEPNLGQDDKKEGIWLDAAYILEEDDKAYVWADNGHGKLEKRKVTLGEFDEQLYMYKIEDGITEEDLITYNEFGLEEKMNTKPGNNIMSGMSNPNEPDNIDEGNPDMEESGVDFSEEVIIEENEM